jgi:ParB family chromosome partitioning protein
MPGNEGQSFTLPKQRRTSDLFSTQESRDDAQREKVQEIPIDKIDDFLDHPFHVKNDEAMQTMAASIREVGIQTPLIVRPKDDGHYEIISGHRRKFAATLAGLEALPCIVREMTRDEAVIAMVDANLQREVILPSEKAFSYKMKLDALRRQGKRTDLTSSPMEMKLKGKQSLAVVGEAVGDSKDTVHRFIRLTSLIPTLLQMTDDGKIAFRPAVELSYLQKTEQEILLEAMQAQDATPSLAQAIKMKQFSQEGKLTPVVIQSIMAKEKPNQVEQFKIPKAKIIPFFAPGTSAKDMEAIVIKALEQYRQREKRREGAER